MNDTTNYEIIGFVKKQSKQDWTKLPEGTIITIPNDIDDVITFTQDILKTKFTFYIFYLKKI